MEYNNDTRLIDLTVGELKDLFSQLMPAPTVKKEIKLIHGNKALGKFLNISPSSVQRLIATGKLKKATYRTGRKVSYDGSMVLELMKQ